VAEMRRPRRKLPRQTNRVLTDTEIVSSGSPRDQHCRFGRARDQNEADACVVKSLPAQAPATTVL